MSVCIFNLKTTQYIIVHVQYNKMQPVLKLSYSYLGKAPRLSQISFFVIICIRQPFLFSSPLEVLHCLQQHNRKKKNIFQKQFALLNLNQCFNNSLRSDEIYTSTITTYPFLQLKNNYNIIYDNCNWLKYWSEFYNY